MIPRKAKQKKNLSDMDQLSDKPKEISAAASNKSVATCNQETFSEGVLTRNRTSSITKSPAVPRPRTRSLSNSDSLTPDSDKQSPASFVKRASVPAKPEQPPGDNKLRRRRRTKAQIAADNAAKQAIAEPEKKDISVVGLPISKKPGRPRGRPKKIRTPVETPSSTGANSPTSSLQNDEPMPTLNVSNQESLGSPTDQEISQEMEKSPIGSSCDFDVSTENDNVTTISPSVGVTLLKEDELALKDDTPLLKEDVIPPSSVNKVETVKLSDKDAKAVMDEYEEVLEASDNTPTPVETDKQHETLEDPLSQPTVDPNSVHAGHTADCEPCVVKPVELMDASPNIAPSSEIPVKETMEPSPDALADDLLTAVEEKSNFPTGNDVMMDTEPTPVTTAAQEALTQICSVGMITTSSALTNSESDFADSFLTTSAVSNSAQNVAPSVMSLKTPPCTTAGVSNIASNVTSISSVTVSLPSSTTAIDNSTKSIASTVSLSGATTVSNNIKGVTLSVMSSTSRPSVSFPPLLNQSNTIMSLLPTAPPVSLTMPTVSAATVSNSLKSSSQVPLLASVSSASMPSVWPTSTLATADEGKDVAKLDPVKDVAKLNLGKDIAKLDPLPINLNTSLCVTLPTLSSLLTTPSGQQRLVLPLEKLILPSNLETSAVTTGPFISSPPFSKPSHSCSYVITSMQMKDADPVSLAVSTMAQPSKESNLQAVTSQKIISTSHMPITSSMALLESKKFEPVTAENKFREIAPKAIGLEFHHLTSDISRPGVVKKPELYEVLSSLKANRSLGSLEPKLSSFSTSATIASLVGQNSSKEKGFDQAGSGLVIPTDKEQVQHKPRPIAIKPADGMELFRQIPIPAAATTSRSYPNVHPLFTIPAGTKTGSLMPSFDLFRSVPSTQKQFSSPPNISASILPHLPGSSIAAYSTQKAPPPLISITDGSNQTVLGSVRVKVIDAPASAHQSLSSLPAHMKVSRPRPLPPQQSVVSAPPITTAMVSLTGSVSATPTIYSSALQQQQYVPHPLTIGVHASTNSKVPSTTDVMMAHASSSQSTLTSQPTAVVSVTKVKTEYEPAVTSHIPALTSATEYKTSLECPMCRHSVKNYKALCGHMKMHGGWDKSKFSSLDDYVCLYRSSMAAKAQESAAAQKRSHTAVASATESATSDCSLQPPPSKRHEGEPPQVFTFDNNSPESMERRSFINHSSATLDDLCKAAESVRKIVNQPDYLKRRPENIVIPSQYYTSGSMSNLAATEEGHQKSPPYTPPPLLSPRPSMFTNTPLTPRSLYWPQRRSSEAPTVSESEESVTYPEPKINVGDEYQAELGECDESRQGAAQDDDFSELVFKPLENLSRDDEDTLDGYFELACSPAVRLGGRNKEYAYHILHKLGGSVKEAVRVLLSGRSLVPKDSFMASYNYSGSTKWSTRERQRFRRAWRDNHKNFRAIQKSVSSKNMRDVIEYYYTWKKYCMDEYKGRSRHYSMEEELSEDELETINGMTYNEIESYSDRPSSSNSAVNSCKMSSGDQQHSESPRSYTHPQIQSVLLTSSNSTKPSNDTSPRPDRPTFKCTYPGCVAAYSSIFALNGHIRIHGGSFYPPRGEKKEQVKTEENLDGSGVPRDADAKSPRNQAGRSGHSPKRGQTGGASRTIPGTTAKAHKGKRISTTPHDQEGHYPCRLCGRVFDKVKSRSAHMKSHVVKPGGKNN